MPWPHISCSAVGVQIVKALHQTLCKTIFYGFKDHGSREKYNRIKTEIEFRIYQEINIAWRYFTNVYFMAHCFYFDWNKWHIIMTNTFCYLNVHLIWRKERKCSLSKLWNIIQQFYDFYFWYGNCRYLICHKMLNKCCLSAYSVQSCAILLHQNIIQTRIIKNNYLLLAS